VADSFPRTVLVVDDEQVILDVIKVALKRAKLEMVGVTSAEAAFEELKKRPFGAVMADKNLPGKSGLDVIKEARARNPYCACLMMTGYPTLESVVEALRLGATDYLEKPFQDVGLMLKRLESAIEHQRVAFERAALVEALKSVDKQLKQKERAVFEHRTELELFQSVMDVKIEEATSELNIANGKLTAENLALEEKTGAASAKLKALADGLRKLSDELDGVAKEEPADVEKLKKALKEAVRRLSAQAVSLQ
jgi:DNA-binding NtrC family response regulator